jgi:hypothetical protein
MISRDLADGKQVAGDMSDSDPDGEVRAVLHGDRCEDRTPCG